MTEFDAAVRRGAANRTARRAKAQARPRDWAATQQFASDAARTAAQFEAVAQFLRDAANDETTRGGYRTRASVDALGDVAGYAQLALEATRRFDGGILAQRFL